MNSAPPESRSLQSRLVSGSAILLAGSACTAAISFAYNIVVAKFLGPTDFGHAAAVYTILILVSSVTLSFQIVAAKTVAQQSTPEGRASAYQGYHRSAWLFGIISALLLLIFEKGIADFLKVPGPLLVALIAAGVAFYVPLGSRRGYIQGACSFGKLAGNLVLENALRLIGSLALIMLGMGVRGVIIANSAAVLIAYFAITPRLGPHGHGALISNRASRELLTAVVFFSGAALINNSGIVLVKHYFPAVEAGLYAAVAMVGRVIFASASAVANGMFPIIAGSAKEERKSPKLIATSLLLVLGIGCLGAFCLWIAPASFWKVILGAGFEIGGADRLSYLMPLYAIMTTIYSLSAILITYEMAYKIANKSWTQLGISALVVAAICLFHGSLQQVILVQFALMVALLAFVGLPFLINFRKAAAAEEEGVGKPLKLVRRVSEDEVIAEFLKNEIQLDIYRNYRDLLHLLVSRPDFAIATENQIRRVLLFLLHRDLWKELPRDTNWCEVELDQSDLEKIRVFPRAQWRRLARGNFSLLPVVEKLRARQVKIDGAFQAKIETLRSSVVSSDCPLPGAVLLIGAYESGPFTIIDGNHRLVAAALDSAVQSGNLRFFCGISPKMTQCCWYKTNFMTLARYALHLLRDSTWKPESELRRLLRSRDQLSGASHGMCGSAPQSEATTIESTEDASMTTPISVVSVIKAPNRAGNGKAQRQFLKEIVPSTELNRPRIVLDCSGVSQFDKPFVHLLLCCLEEAMKHNGDVRLAGVRPEARAVLDVTRASRLFEIFDSVEEAKNSYLRISWNASKKARPEVDSAVPPSRPAVPDMAVPDGSAGSVNG